MTARISYGPSLTPLSIGMYALDGGIIPEGRRRSI
jgi:hypothetical protein